MELGWGMLALICLAAAVVWFWQDSFAARERANEAAMEACQRLSLQFLDGTVAFARLAFTRERGQLAFRRTYVFDYTANSIERRQGFVVLTGRRVESVGYAPGEEQRAKPVNPPPVTISMSVSLPPAPPVASETNEQSPATRQPSAQVLDLADWRARRRGADPGSSQQRIGGSDPGHTPVDGQDHHR